MDGLVAVDLAAVMAARVWVGRIVGCEMVGHGWMGGWVLLIWTVGMEW